MSLKLFIPLLSLRKKILTFTFCFLILFPFYVSAQSALDKIHAQQLLMTVKVLEKYHYKPQQLDNALSKKLNKEFLNALDPTGLYFSKTEIDGLKKWDDQLDDEILNGSTIYLSTVTSLFKKKLKWADSIITVISDKPFDFKEKDTLNFSNTKEDIIYASSEKALMKRWTKLMKYETLKWLYTVRTKNEDPFSKDIKEILKDEGEARTKIAARMKRSIARIIDNPDGYEDYISSIYINQLVSLYDPHSSFFSASEKKDFESSLSANELSFGFDFNENENGEIEIVHIAPGGSAWKSNQLHKGDIILSIKPELGNLIDLGATDSDEAMNLMRAMKEDQAEFTIKKTNGQIKKVVLIRSKIRSEENAVKSFILDGEKKIGYISLPSFYTEFENNNPLGCANDVAKEIVKLEEEHIEGLVLDLRENGGGSVLEAMGLIGLFVDEGPLCIYKTRNEKPLLLKDMNRGTAYSGPLVIMVNGMSASASEICSASLQDYNRALLVGSPTYGKATGQIIVPLDTTYSLAELRLGARSTNENKLGFLKITIEGFYRVTNSSYQKKGVKPDIDLLEPYFYNDYKESSFPSALPNDSIVKKVVYSPLAPLPLQELKKKSVERITKNKNYERLIQINDSLLKISKQEISIVLDPQFFKKNEKRSKELLEDMEANMLVPSTTYKVVNNEYDKKIIGLDDFTKETNDRSLKNIQEDIYIEEVYSVIKDLIIFIKN